MKNGKKNEQKRDKKLRNIDMNWFIIGPSMETSIAFSPPTPSYNRFIYVSTYVYI